MHIPKSVLQAGGAVAILIVLGLGVLLWAQLPDRVPAEPIAPPTPTATPTPTLSGNGLESVNPGGPKPCKHCHHICDDAHGGDANPACQACIAEHCILGADPSADAIEHCGCEGACEKCHHLCLDCHCGSHIIDRGVKCQEYAACEAGCSGEQDCPPREVGGDGAPSDSPGDMMLYALNLVDAASETLQQDDPAVDPSLIDRFNTASQTIRNALDDWQSDPQGAADDLTTAIDEIAKLGSDVLDLDIPEEAVDTITAALKEASDELTAARAQLLG